MHTRLCPEEGCLRVAYSRMAAGGLGPQGEAGICRKWLPLTLYPLCSEPSFSNRGFMGAFWAEAPPTLEKPQFSVALDLSLRFVLEELLFSVCPVCPRARNEQTTAMWGWCLGPGAPWCPRSQVSPPPLPSNGTFCVSDVGLPYRICLKKGSFGSKEKV